MSTLKNSSSIALALLLIAPATSYGSEYDLIPAEKVSATKGDENKDLAVDAMRVQHLFVFPNAIGSKMTEMATKGDADAFGKIQGLFCDGKRPRSKAEMKIILVPPTPPKGQSIEKVANLKKRFIELAKRYLKEGYFFELANTEFSGADKTNPDFANYKRYVLDSGYERKYTNRFSTTIPFVPAQKKKPIVEFYKSVKFMPSLSSMRWDDPWDTIEHAQTNLLFIFLPSESITLLLPKAVAIYKGEWGHGNKGTEVKGGIGFASSDSLETSDSLQTFYRNANYMASETEWKLKELPENSIFPLQLSNAEDLAFLKKNYSFILPVDVAKKVFGDLDEKDITQYVGYTKDDAGKLTFSSSLAIEHTDFLWQGVLAAQTKITQADQSDGTIVFDLTLDMDLACKYMVPLADMQSR